MSTGKEGAGSGIAGLDDVLAGGFTRGHTYLVEGTPGTGKTILGLQFLREGARHHEPCLHVTLAETAAELRTTAASHGWSLDGHVQAGRLVLEQVDAAELSPGEFAHRIRARVEQDGARLVVVDSLNGYHAAMPEEQFLVLHMHELLVYLNRQGVVTLLTMAQHGLLGEMRSPVDVTYLSDTLVLLRFFEAAGRVRRAISVVKKRMGAHEDTIREFQVTPHGLQLGAPLEAFQGVLAGVPSYRGQSGPLLGGGDRP